MKKSIIKSLCLFSGFIERCFINDKDEVKIHYELVDKDKRHIYEISEFDDVFEGVSKSGVDSSNGSSDSFIVMSHPREDYKLMMIADGKGYVADPDTKKVITSAEYVTSNFKNWFSSLSHNTLKEFNKSGFNGTLNKCLKRMNEKLRSIPGEHGTKMIMVIVGPENTLIANLGDLRCYLGKGFDLVQYNEEDSLLWREYREGYFCNKEEFRFNKKRYEDVSQFGVDKGRFVSSYIIDNSIYDRIYLFSRGVIDCVSEDRLTVFNSDTPVDRVVNAIIDEATNGVKEHITYYDGDSNNLEAVVHGKKDATACVYIKSKRN